LPTSRESTNPHEQKHARTSDPRDHELQGSFAELQSKKVSKRLRDKLKAIRGTEGEGPMRV